MSEETDDRTHPASRIRLRQARDNGDVAKSQELASSIQMIGAILIAWLLFGQIGHWLMSSTTGMWNGNHGIEIGDSNEMAAQFTTGMRRLIYSSLGVLLPVFALVLLTGIASHWCQTGPLFLPKKVALDADRLSPKHWWNQLLSWKSMAFPLIGLPKSLLALGVMGGSCWINRDEFFLLGAYPADEMVRAMFGLILQTCSHVAVVLLLASVVDFGFAWSALQQRLKMSDQQTRDEARMEEVNPRVKSMQQKRQREIKTMANLNQSVRFASPPTYVRGTETRTTP